MRVVQQNDAHRLTERYLPFYQKVRIVFIGSKTGCKHISKIIETALMSLSEIRQLCFLFVLFYISLIFHSYLCIAVFCFCTCNIPHFQVSSKIIIVFTIFAANFY
jgi:hypothetical protein